MASRSANGFGWRFVVGAVPIGLLFAALTITGSIDGVGPTKWVASGLIAAIGAAVGLGSSGRPFLHGLAAGFAAGLVAVETQALFSTFRQCTMTSLCTGGRIHARHPTRHPRRLPLRPASLW